MKPNSSTNSEQNSSNSEQNSSQKLEKNSVKKNKLEIEDLNFDDIEDFPEEDFELFDYENPFKKSEPKTNLGSKTSAEKSTESKNSSKNSSKNPSKNPNKNRSNNQERPLGEFYHHVLGYMDLHSDAETVKKYLNGHHNWFRRCAAPMQADPLGSNGYALTIGKVGAFGFVVEPKIGLNLLPVASEIYKIETIPIPNHPPQAYVTDFRATFELLPKLEVAANQEPKKLDITNIEWQLELTVILEFPQFIKIMPKILIQKTGNAILAQIVRQISRRLTTKVQHDFHKTRGIKIPQGKP